MTRNYRSEKRKQDEAALAPHIRVTASITCQECGLTEEYPTDELSAADKAHGAEVFYESGWRVVNGEPRCKAHTR
jgi:hypothetical protein